MRRKWLLTLLCLMLAAVLPAAAESPVKRIADRTDHFYNHLKTLKADFTETYTGPGISRSESGTLWLKRPGRMRWDYTQPRHKLFISDGHTAWFYVPGEPQVRRAPVKKLDDLRSPLRYLLGKTRLEKEFENLRLVEGVTVQDPQNQVLAGTPKHLADRVTEVQLEIGPQGRICRIFIEEVDGSTTEFHFSSLEENVSLPDSFFHFTPPPGAEVIEALEGEF